MNAASQLILHPAVTDSLKVASTTVGRDKAYRTVQYAARALAWFYAQRGYSKESVAQMSALKAALATTRKVMRLGKPMEHFQAAVKATATSDPILRLTAIARQLGYAFYLLNDHLVWLHSAKIKVFDKQRIARINTNAARCWAFGIAASILSGMYKLRGIQLRSAKAAKQQSTPEKESDRKVQLKQLNAQYYDARFQLVQDLLDFTIPMTTLGYFRFNEGVLGVAGFITSLMGLYTQQVKVLGVKSIPSGNQV